MCEVNSLCSECERGARDARRQVETLADLAPQLLVDDVNESTLRHDETKQFEQVQRLLGHDRDPVDRCS